MFRLSANSVGTVYVCISPLRTLPFFTSKDSIYTHPVETALVHLFQEDGAHASLGIGEGLLALGAVLVDSLPHDFPITFSMNCSHLGVTNQTLVIRVNHSLYPPCKQIRTLALFEIIFFPVKLV